MIQTPIQKNINIVAVERISPEVSKLHLERKDFYFMPGQFITLAVDGRIVEFSIASGIEDPYLSVLYRTRRNNHTTPSLRGLKEGDSIRVSGPYGQFTIPDAGGRYLLLAKDTGIAPFLSYVASYPNLTSSARSPISFVRTEAFWATSTSTSVVTERRCSNSSLTSDPSAFPIQESSPRYTSRRTR